MEKKFYYQCFFLFFYLVMFGEINVLQSAEQIFPREIWHEIINLVINSLEIKNKIESAKTIPELKQIINEIYKSLPMSKMHNEFLVKILNSIYIAKKHEIIKNILEKAYPDLSFGWFNNIDSIVGYGITALTIVSRRGDKDIAELLIENGANLDVQDRDNRTVLMNAIEYSNEDIAKLLIEKGANLNIKDINGKTALMYSIKYFFNKVTELLIQKGVDINIEDNNGNTALIIAARNGNKKIVQLLIDKGACLNLLNKKGDSALNIATNKGNEEIMQLLKASGAVQ